MQFDAQTGQPLYYNYSSKSNFGVYFEQDWNNDTPIPVQPPTQAKKVHNQQQARALVQEEFNVKMEELQPSDVETIDMNDGKDVRYKFGHVNLITDKASGRVIQVFDSSSDSPKKGTIKETDARKAAIKFVQRYLDPWETELILGYSIQIKDGLQEGDYAYQFFSSYQGIPVFPTRTATSSYRVEVDSMTGKITDFSKELPDSKTVVTPEVAAQEWMKHYKLKLYYFITEDNKIRLIYEELPRIANANQKVHIDATTGQSVLIAK
ncbi:hypothetical protein [Brevibacillus daliensis]|uniref:hypothetical protein n=1 Tax=Brevibacillus daliensis TaxID=2892995 RepID=UPI001E5D80DD|nr:hypothetical protein [Brevibacillus daliensis]